MIPKKAIIAITPATGWSYILYDKETKTFTREPLAVWALVRETDGMSYVEGHTAQLDGVCGAESYDNFRGYFHESQNWDTHLGILQANQKDYEEAEQQPKK